MTNTHKTIKYIAIAFAIFLIVNIIAAIVIGLSSITNIIEPTTPKGKTKELKISSKTTDLDIEVAAVNVIIREGKKLHIETDNEYVNSTQNDNKLYIKEKSHNYFKTRNDRELIIYIPENYIFNTIKINAGAGKVTAENLTSKQMELKIGAGKIEIDEISITENTEIEGGVGSFKIKKGLLSNLDLEGGVGSLDITSKIIGKSKIESGIGKLNLKLIGNPEDYSLSFEKGIGSFKLNGDSIKSNQTYGNGDSQIIIKGGVGSTTVNYLEEEN